MTKIATLLVSRDSLAGMQGSPVGRVGHPHPVVTANAGLLAVTSEALAGGLESIAAVALAPALRLMVRRLPALVTGAAGVDRVTLPACLVFLSLAMASQELGVVRRRQALRMTMFARWQRMAGGAVGVLLLRGIAMFRQPVAAGARCAGHGTCRRTSARGTGRRCLSPCEPPPHGSGDTGPCAGLAPCSPAS